MSKYIFSVYMMMSKRSASVVTAADGWIRSYVVVAKLRIGNAFYLFEQQLAPDNALLQLFYRIIF